MEIRDSNIEKRIAKLEELLNNNKNTKKETEFTQKLREEYKKEEEPIQKEEFKPVEVKKEKKVTGQSSGMWKEVLDRLKKTGKSVLLPDNAATRGMVKQVEYLVKVEEA